MTEKSQTVSDNTSQQNVPSRPNEQGQLNIDDFLRIYDPNTQKVLVEKRS